MQSQPFNQLPPLRQSLSDSSLRSTNDDHHPSSYQTASRSGASNSTTTSDHISSSPRSFNLQQQQQYHPALHLPLPALSSVAAPPELRGGESSHSGSQQQQHHLQHHHPHQPHSQYHSSPGESSPHTSRASSARSQYQPEMMYPNYSQQYPAHQLPSNAQYGGTLPQHQHQQSAGRMLPSGASGMLPPVYSQSNYATHSLPGPLPYDNGAAQQILTPASTTHTLQSSNSVNYGPESNFQGTRGNYKYELRVEQQPQRARMCGFGDKDRRPITPPPCVRLIVRRVDTGEEVDVDRLDGAFFVLQVDLWNADASREVNIIRASSSAPSQSISTAVQMGYPPPAAPLYVDNMGYSVNQFGVPSYVVPPQVQHSNSHVLYTRNLIGSLSVNASLLKDTEDNLGYWFVLSDLSVRTEGWFRLRMTFIDVGTPGANGGEATLNRQRCPVLSSIFSDKFQVYSAKKFPGVIESTPLSKCFAHQGIKIPIRKDGKGDKNDDDDGL